MSPSGRHVLQDAEFPLQRVEELFKRVGHSPDYIREYLAQCGLGGALVWGAHE
jgi:hypothetical protein